MYEVYIYIERERREGEIMDGVLDQRLDLLTTYKT
jgi:hypothetical protein